MSLQTNILNFGIIVDLVNQYADAIRHESKIRQMHNLYNKTRGLQDKCNWYTSQLKSTLSPEQSNDLSDLVKQSDALGAVEVLEYALMLDDTEREKFLTLIKALQNNKKIEVKIID